MTMWIFSNDNIFSFSTLDEANTHIRACCETWSSSNCIHQNNVVSLYVTKKTLTFFSKTEGNQATQNAGIPSPTSTQNSTPSGEDDGRNPSFPKVPFDGIKKISELIHCLLILVWDIFLILYAPSISRESIESWSGQN